MSIERGLTLRLANSKEWIGAGWRVMPALGLFHDVPHGKCENEAPPEETLKRERRDRKSLVRQSQIRTWRFKCLIWDLGCNVGQ